MEPRLQEFPPRVSDSGLRDFHDRVRLNVFSLEFGVNPFALGDSTLLVLVIVFWGFVGDVVELLVGLLAPRDSALVLWGFVGDTALGVDPAGGLN